MKMPDPTELVTSDNFDAAAYLAANPDVRLAGVDAWKHFQAFGRSEGRRQSASSVEPHFETYRRRKFDLFSSMLLIDDGEIRPETFPVSVGASHFDLADYAHESANPGFGPFDEVVRANPDKLYADIGCGLRHEVFENCLYVEVYPSRSADLIVEPNCTYPIRSGSLDGIGCFAVLEHTRRPWLVVQEMRRMLKPDGRVFIDWPFLQPVHGFPSHFFNATREGLRSLFEDNGFEIEFCGTGLHQTPAYTVNWILREMINRLPAGAVREDLQDMRVRDLVALDVQSREWRRILDALPDDAVSQFACGNWLSGRKA